MSVQPPRLAYLEIKRDLINGVFDPSTSLNIKSLELRYRRSAIPIREALSALAAEDLVDLIPGRGFQAKTFEFLDIANHLDIIEMLLVNSAHYISRSNPRRAQIGQVYKHYFPSDSRGLARLTAYEVADSLTSVLQNIERRSHAGALQRSVFYVAPAIRKSLRPVNLIPKLHLHFQNYVHKIATNGPEEAAKVVTFFMLKLKNSMTSAIYSGNAGPTT